MTNPNAAPGRAEMPTGTNAILNTRTLATAHARLADMLQTGMHVLDVGCGTGAITRGIAEAVGPAGHVVGLDPNAGLIAEARQLYGDVPGLHFEIGDIYTLDSTASYDVATAARVLQWLNRPADALTKMTAVVKPGGQVVVLDYNHEKVQWIPEPPATFQLFYDKFLQWRADAGMDNAIADHLSTLFEDARLSAVQQTVQSETTRRSDSDFETRIGIWAQVAKVRGPQIVADGYLTEQERATAEADYRAWIAHEAQSQTMYLLCVEGRNRP